MPSSVRILSDLDEKPSFVVRGTDPAAIHAAAVATAARNALVVTDRVEEIQVGHIRAVPCPPHSHLIDGFSCEGGFSSHYVTSPPGSGAFQGAFVNARHRTREERETVNPDGE
jgi:hypothetical protein